MQLTASRTSFRWNRSLSTPAKFHYIPTAHIWILTVLFAFLCLMFLNCDHVVCTASNSWNTSIAAAEYTTSTIESVKPTHEMLLRENNSTSASPVNESRKHNYNCSLGNLTHPIAFCRNIAIEEICCGLEKWNGTIDLIKVDNQTRKEFDTFHDIMARVDCRRKYSVSWNCSHCLDAYKNWICESYFTAALKPTGLKPTNNCSSNLCHDVIQRCPYFLPATDNQYSGQPVFDCQTKGESEKCWTRFSPGTSDCQMDSDNSLR